MKIGRVDRVRSDWAGALLVCAKCSKKLDGGFGPKGTQRLAKALAAQPGVGRRRKAGLGVVEVKCLGLCPRGAVTVSPPSLHSDQPGMPQQSRLR